MCFSLFNKDKSFFFSFQLDDQINWIKNHTQIYYPENNVNLFEQSLYTLYSVVNHDGTITDGHYTTYSKKFDLWFQFDDEKIEYLPIEKLHSNPNAYLLFYVNKSIWSIFPMTSILLFFLFCTLSFLNKINVIMAAQGHFQLIIILKKSCISMTTCSITKWLISKVTQ